MGEKAPHVLILSMDDAWNLKGSGARIVLKGRYDHHIEQSLRFNFKSNNNIDEYETLITDMNIALEIGASSLSPGVT